MDLQIELIPRTAWNSNLRKLLKTSQWDKVRKIAYSEQNYKCAICDSRPMILEAHEIWDFDPVMRVQKLVSVVALCQPCHSVIHFGRSEILGYSNESYQHYRKVTGKTKKQFERMYLSAKSRFIELSNIEHWTLDLSYIERYGIDHNSIAQNIAPIE